MPTASLPTLSLPHSSLSSRSSISMCAPCLVSQSLVTAHVHMYVLHVSTALREMGKTMVDCQRTSTYRSVRFLPPPPPPTSINSGSRNEADALNSTASEGAAGLGRTKTETLVVLTRSLSTRVHRVLTLSRAKGEATLASMPDEEEEDEEDRVNASCGSEALDVEQVRRHRSRRPRRVSGIHTCSHVQCTHTHNTKATLRSLARTKTFLVELVDAETRKSTHPHLAQHRLPLCGLSRVATHPHPLRGWLQSRHGLARLAALAHSRPPPVAQPHRL